MLLYALTRELFQPGPQRPDRPARRAFPDAGAMIAAGTFVAVWCLLRLWAAREAGGGVDVAIAIPCLLIGLRAAHSGVVSARAALVQL